MTPSADLVARLLRELVTLVRGECPALLNEDSGGDARLSMAIDDALASPPAKDIWRCFHCGEVFTTWGSAQDHFGVRDGVVPGCLIDQVAVEEGGKPERGRGLLMALRTAEAAYERLQAQQLEEDTTLHRELARVRSEMDAAVRRAEEAGYARGLAAALAAPPAEDAFIASQTPLEPEARAVLAKHRSDLYLTAQAPPASDPLAEPPEDARQDTLDRLARAVAKHAAAVTKAGLPHDSDHAIGEYRAILAAGKYPRSPMIYEAASAAPPDQPGHSGLDHSVDLPEQGTREDYRRVVKYWRDRAVASEQAARQSDQPGLDIEALRKEVDRWSRTHSVRSERTRGLMYRLLDALRAAYDLSAPAPMPTKGDE